MKKLSIILIGTAAIFAGCHKRSKDVSQVVTASIPTVTITGSQFYSIHVGGAFPDVSATAYDSVLHESYPATVDKSTLDNTTPGLYIIKATAKNKNGYPGTAVVYIAVTDISDNWDLSGVYDRSGFTSNVTKVARGLYLNDNLAGSSLVVPGYFAQTSESTIDVPLQPTPPEYGVGDMDATDETLTITPTDTSFSYKVVNAAFGTQVRTFVKQH
ncbi:MAG: hypothetical protein JSS82_06915 [Bacteroidetes bacterium]|nr:hypothetical protein [Bacteroidota bacterium]